MHHRRYTVDAEHGTLDTSMGKDQQQLCPPQMIQQPKRRTFETRTEAGRTWLNS
eukprot:COSAG05_NODE_14620_length_392_cov_0.604096_2_plen_53_part_01